MPAGDLKRVPEGVLAKQFNFEVEILSSHLSIPLSARCHVAGSLRALTGGAMIGANIEYLVCFAL